MPEIYTKLICGYLGAKDKLFLSSNQDAMCVHCEWHRRGYMYRTCILATDEIAPKVLYGPFELVRFIQKNNIKVKKPLCVWALGPNPDFRKFENPEEHLWAKWTENGELIDPYFKGWPDGINFPERKKIDSLLSS